MGFDGVVKSRDDRYDPATIEGFLRELLELEEGLTDWEVRFLEDMDAKRELHGRGSFTSGQAAKIRQIHETRIK